MLSATQGATMGEKPVQPQLIEATAKRFKLGQAVGVLLICLGAGTCGISSAGNSETGVGAGIAILLSGVALYAASRFGAWWKHG